MEAFQNKLEFDRLFDRKWARLLNMWVGAQIELEFTWHVNSHGIANIEIQRSC